MADDANDRKPEDPPKDDVVEYFGADGRDEGEEFHESGEIDPELDDQTIVPPG